MIKKSLPLELHIRKDTSKYNYSICCQQGKHCNLYLNYLRDCGLMGKKSKDKFIPDVYKINSIENRIELLRGLCDTDGSITEKGVIEYCTVSKKLAYDVQWLVHSLGGKCSVKFTTNKFLGRYRLRIRIAKINPFNLKRKADRFVIDYGRSDVRFIWKIEKVRREKSRCILMDHPSHLYLTDNFVVTHNTIGACILLIWLCWYNKMPATIAKVTIWYVVSRDDDAAKEFLGKMRMLLYEGDRHMSQFTGETDYFTGSLKEPNNTEQITFLNNCFFKSVPPTKKALGKSGNLWIDEAHRLNCKEISTEEFFDLASAMTAETNGAIVLSSSPEGIVGFFHRAIDPENEYHENEYEHFWFDHTIWDDGTKECIQYQAHVQAEKKRLVAAGRFKMWQQEYGALFTVTMTSFFEHEDIDKAIKDTAQQYTWHGSPCSVAYDYGMTNARTVITIRTKIKDKETGKEETTQLFQFRAPAGFDNNKLHEESWEHSIQNLKERYDLEQLGVFADDCANGFDNNNWIKEHASIPITLYNFRSDQSSLKDGLTRNSVAYSYRARLKEGTIKIPKWNKIQQQEMKIVQETAGKLLITIKAPDGHLCDTFDSDMMACIPFLDMQNVVEWDVDVILEPEEEEIDRKSLRSDRGIKPLTDEECKEMIKDANEGGFNF